MQIERVVDGFQAGGTEIDLARVWPFQHARIIPNDTCFLNWPQDKMAEAPQPWRPLRPLP